VPTNDGHDDNGGRDGRAIDACGTVITARGDYTVTRDLVECPGTGIRVNTSDVTIHLDGHIIDGPGANANKNGIDVGVGVPGGVRGVKLLGPGLVREFFGGIVFEQVADSRVVGVTVERNVFGLPINAGFSANEATHYSHDNVFDGNEVMFNVGHGFTLNGSSTTLIANNDIHENGDVGVLLYAGGSNVVRDNQLIANGTGVKVQNNPDSHGHLITRNTALRNFSTDLVDAWGDCTHDTWLQNVFGTSFPACIH
jgi:parallel beta-helix repeat protein